MKNLLLSAAIGDICGMPYEFDERTKNYAAVNLLHPKNDYTDDTVCTFACADALLHNTDMAQSLRMHCREDIYRGYGGRFFDWLMSDEFEKPYMSYGNGSAMRVSAAGFMATTPDNCIKLATLTASPTHNHPEGIKGAVAAAMVTHLLFRYNVDKEYIRNRVLKRYYPDWYMLSYDTIKRNYDFDETCQRTVPAAIICFLHSQSYEDCLKLAISLGGDADTLAAIAGPMAYAYYKEMPQELIDNAKAKLPQWMLDLNNHFDDYISCTVQSEPSEAPSLEAEAGQFYKYLRNTSFSVDGLYYHRITDTGVAVYSIDGCPNNLVIPSSVTHDGVRYTVIGVYRRGFQNRTELESVTLPYGLCWIAAAAFRGCTNLKSVSLPSSLTSICEEAFCGCERLEQIYFNGCSVRSLRHSFRGCKSLKEVHINGVGDWCASDFHYDDGNPLYYAGQLYYNWGPLSDLVIPQGVTNIRNRAFANCKSIESVTIPASVTSIGLEAFEGCINLKIVTNHSKVDFGIYI